MLYSHTLTARRFRWTTGIRGAGPFGGMAMYRNSAGRAGRLAADFTAILLVAADLAIVAPVPGQTPPCATPPASLVSWWAGEDASDRVGGGNGTLLNGAAIVAGKVGQAFSFDGVDDYVSIPHSDSLQPPQITVEAWIKTPGSADLQLIVDKSHGWIDNTGWALHVMPDGRIVWGYGFGSGFPACFSAGAVDNNQWHHVAATLDGSTLRVFIDGALDGTLGYSGTPAGNTRRVHIGASFHGDLSYRSASFVRHFNGLIDEVTLYDRALSAADIQTIHAAGVSGKCDPPVDTFDGNVLDLQKWKISSPLGASTVTQNNALLLANNGTNGTFCFTPESFGPGTGVALRNKLVGDFDIQVSFSGFSGPFQDHVQAFFNIYQDPNNQLHIKRIRASSLDGIQTVAKVGGVFPIQSGVSFDPVTSGALRIVRNGSQISTFLDNGPEFSISAFSEPVIVSLMLSDPAPSSVAFDNFYIRSGTLIQPPLTCPDDNQPPVADCGGAAISVEATGPDGAVVTLDGSLSSDPDGDVLEYHWDVSDLSVILSGADSPVASGTFPIGVTMATLTVTDGNGGFDTCDVTVSVSDSTPPQVMCTSDLAVLWPPNHTMRAVRLLITGTDTVSDPANFALQSITVRSDEPDDATGLGDGDTTGDVNGYDGYSTPVNVTVGFAFDADGDVNGAWVATIQLRAERDGDGDGRCYTIDAIVADANGNPTTTSCCIVVPHDRRRR